MKDHRSNGSNEARHVTTTTTVAITVGAERPASAVIAAPTAEAGLLVAHLMRAAAMFIEERFSSTSFPGTGASSAAVRPQPRRRGAARVRRGVSQQGVRA